MRIEVAAFAVIALLPTAANAATVFKCVDASGKITFTQQSCPANHQLDDVVSARNQSISGSGPAAVMADPQRREVGVTRYQEQQSPTRRGGVTVVGGSAERAPCATGLSERDLRTAKVRGEIVPGMSRKDVEGMYGKVNRNGSAHGAGMTTYWNDKYLDATSVSYDSGGCVRSTYQSGHRN